MKRCFAAFEKDKVSLIEAQLKSSPSSGNSSNPKALEIARAEAVVCLSISQEAWKSLKFELSNHNLEIRELKGDMILSPVISGNLAISMKSMINYLPPEAKPLIALLEFAREQGYFTVALWE